MYYFTYGSNMDKDDLDKWCKKRGYESIKFLNIKPAKLKNYKLSFNYYSNTREAGAANIMRSSDDVVYGLLVEMGDKSKKTIRKKEGYPNYYNEILVDVETFDGQLFKDVFTYKVFKEKEENRFMPPTKYYLGLIIRNADRYNFPKEYMSSLKSITTKD